MFAVNVHITTHVVLVLLLVPNTLSFQIDSGCKFGWIVPGLGFEVVRTDLRVQFPAVQCWVNTWKCDRL